MVPGITARNIATCVLGSRRQGEKEGEDPLRRSAAAERVADSCPQTGYFFMGATIRRNQGCTTKR
jgi:hypothetical protein